MSDKYRRVVAISLLIMMSPLATKAADPVEINYEAQRLDARYRLFKTNNTWNFLELDTQTGKVWQVQYSVGEIDNRMKIELMSDVIVGGGKAARFTLYPTRNIFNFILLDQDNGRTWQVQWNTGKERGSWPIELKKESEWKQ